MKTFKWIIIFTALMFFVSGLCPHTWAGPPKTKKKIETEDTNRDRLEVQNTCPPSVVRVVRCGSLDATIIGSDGNDTLEGTPGDDVIHGLGGNDTLFGRGGNDIICGGDGRDIIHGNSGDDKLYGGAGDDRLLGESGNDNLNGHAGNDVCNGGAGADTFTDCETEVP